MFLADDTAATPEDVSLTSEEEAILTLAREVGPDNLFASRDFDGDDYKDRLIWLESRYHKIQVEQVKAWLRTRAGAGRPKADPPFANEEAAEDVPAPKRGRKNA